MLLLRSKSEETYCSFALLYATSCPSCSKFRSVRVCARRSPIGWRGEEAGAGEGKQAQLLADAGILQQLWRVERSEFRRRISICAPERMMLARRECTYGAIGVIVDRFVPHITVRAGAAHSVASIDRMSGPVRKRAWPRGAKLRGGVERCCGEGGKYRRAHHAGSAHFP